MQMDRMKAAGFSLGSDIEMIDDFVDNIVLPWGDEGDESHGLSATGAAFGRLAPYFSDQTGPGWRRALCGFLFEGNCSFIIPVTARLFSRPLPYTLFPHTMSEMVRVGSEVPGRILVRFGHVCQ